MIGQESDPCCIEGMLVTVIPRYALRGCVAVALMLLFGGMIPGLAAAGDNQLVYGGRVADFALIDNRLYVAVGARIDEFQLGNPSVSVQCYSVAAILRIKTIADKLVILHGDGSIFRTSSPLDTPCDLQMLVPSTEGVIDFSLSAGVVALGYVSGEISWNNIDNNHILRGNVNDVLSGNWAISRIVDTNDRFYALAFNRDLMRSDNEAMALISIQANGQMLGLSVVARFGNSQPYGVGVMGGGNHLVVSSNSELIAVSLVGGEARDLKCISELGTHRFIDSIAVKTDSTLLVLLNELTKGSIATIDIIDGNCKGAAQVRSSPTGEMLAVGAARTILLDRNVLYDIHINGDGWETVSRLFQEKEMSAFAWTDDGRAVIASTSDICVTDTPLVEACPALPHPVAAIVVVGGHAFLATSRKGLDVMALKSFESGPVMHLDPQEDYHRYEDIASTNDLIVAAINLTPPRAVRSRGRFELLQYDVDQMRRLDSLDVDTTGCGKLILDTYYDVAVIACGNSVTITRMSNGRFVNGRKFSVSEAVTAVSVLSRNIVIVTTYRDAIRIDVDEGRSRRIDVDGREGLRALSRDPSSDLCVAVVEKPDGGSRVYVAQYCLEEATRFVRSPIAVIVTTRSSYLFAIEAHADGYLVGNGMGGVVRIPRTTGRAIYLPQIVVGRQAR